VRIRASEKPAAAPADPVANEPSVAIVHDYLNQRGGAERVVLELGRMWPHASLYTSLYRPASTFPEFASLAVRTSRLNRLPVDRGFRALAPLYPLAFRSLGRLAEDVVISSTSGWAHGVRTAPGSLHIVYCHTPARWLYRTDEHLGASVGPLLMRPLTPGLRRWDRRAAAHADLYVANCKQVQDRIRMVYGRESTVVYPPVDVERFSARPRGERLLVISRLLPYKRVDLAVQAATSAGIGLDVVGVGPELPKLRRLAGPTVRLHGRVDDEVLTGLLESCRALCVAATEDFGITPVEANAAGKPVVAFAAGGALETVQDGVNGALFGELSEASLLAAVARADAIEASPAELRGISERFSASVFRERFASVVREALEHSAR
jgi:glycosyltransferase involved in cell wall biosynthesis